MTVAVGKAPERRVATLFGAALLHLLLRASSRLYPPAASRLSGGSIDVCGNDGVTMKPVVRDGWWRGRR